jgi:hypothetical protein
MPIALIFHDDECVPARDIPSTEELEKAWNEYVESEAGYPKFKYPDKKVLKRPRFNFQDVRVDPQAKGELEDLSDEEHRTYVYEDGELTLQEPVYLCAAWLALFHLAAKRRRKPHLMIYTYVICDCCGQTLPNGKYQNRDFLNDQDPDNTYWELEQWCNECHDDLNTILRHLRTDANTRLNLELVEATDKFRKQRHEQVAANSATPSVEPRRAGHGS